MILLCGNVSSSNLIDAGRPIVRGKTVPGKMTKLRTGKIESVLGIAGISRESSPPEAVSRTGCDSLGDCKTLI